jgi:hypothetical protein
MNKELNKMFQIKVVLLHTPTGWPLVWRRIQVPANIPLDRFHRVLQFSMGWQDRHLHEFRIGERKFGDPKLEAEFSQGSVEDERKVRLDHVLSRSNASAIYEYDYGNTWEHELVLEETVYKERGREYPVCIDGFYQCPPEDCDGMEDYERLLRMSEDPYDRLALRNGAERSNAKLSLLPGHKCHVGRETLFHCRCPHYQIDTEPQDGKT